LALTPRGMGAASTACLCAGHGVVGRRAQQRMELPAADPHVAAVVQGKTQRVLHQAGQRVEVGVGIDTDNAHGIVDSLNAQFRTVNLGDDGQFAAASLGDIKLVTGFPGQVARGLDAHLDVGQHEANVLVLNHRHRAGALVGAGKLQGDVEGRAHHTYAGRADERRSPGEGIFHHGNAIARLAHNIGRRHAHIVEMDARRDRRAMADGIEKARDLDAQGAAGHHDDRQRLLRRQGRIGAAYDAVQVRALAVPTGAVGGVVLCAVDDPFVAFEAGECLHAGGGVGAVVVSAAGDLSEGQGGQARAIFDEVRQEAALLLLGAVVQHRVQTQAGAQQGRRQVDVGGGEFFGSQGKIQRGQGAAAARDGQQRLDEAGVDHCIVERPRGVEPVFRSRDWRDGGGDLAEDFGGEGSRACL